MRGHPRSLNLSITKESARQLLVSLREFLTVTILGQH